MASVFTHSFTGFALVMMLPKERRTSALVLTAVIAPALPDLDSLGFFAGVPYDSFFGHRGFFHSFCFSAILAALIAAMIFRYARVSYPSLSLFLTFVVSTHALLDAMTTGGRGVALFSPFNNDRIFFPFRVILVSPMNISDFFGEWGVNVMKSEILYVWIPLCVILMVIKIFQSWKH